MASSYHKHEEMSFNRDEVERLTEALKDKNFRKLLTDYVDEVQDPENQRKYQEEISQFEKERGIDVTFINPVAGYVIKTSINGNEKAFINICANENVSKPTSTIGVVDGAQGRHWTVPHTLAPPRHDYDKKLIKCQVFDVVFHPETLNLAHKFKAFRDMVNKTACDAVESNFDVVLDRKNLKFPKLQFKGLAHASVIRKPSKEGPPQWTPEEKAVMDEFYAKAGADYPPPQKKAPKSPKKNKTTDNSDSVYTTPNDSHLSEKYLAMASMVKEEVNDVTPVLEEAVTEVMPEPTKSRAINIASSLSESSGDELSCSYSPSKGKGILKSFVKPRFGRSISESGLDEVTWVSSIENFASVDSIIPEEEEISSSLKKTVRFSNVVSRKLFRSNSSILGQKKKKSWKAKAKKRARDRRHSEGEVSDVVVDSSERDCETAKESNNDIFQLEIN